MGVYALDTSAIVKRYIAESGHAWTVTLCDPSHAHVLYITQAALVEVVATFCRKAREANISVAERDRLIAEFRKDCTGNFAVIPVTTNIYTRAGDLCQIHALRAYDAVQLACVLSLRDDALALGAPLPTFVCADNDLLSFAKIEGLNTENPNIYP
ncbi:MAG: hypothetical protein OJF49_001898 [Ktedonobacterales bacterium]|jgi:predicted nucleic acid-binding protein|nr:MAG: hypothetical protein OJF49_001898 [Ktedonobacterales bacterium]